MKVLHVLDHSLPVQDGYAYRSREILRFTRALGVETAQITSAKHGACDVDHEEVEDVRYHRVAPSDAAIDRLPILDQWSVVRTLRARLESLVAEELPDLLHVHSPALNGVAALQVARPRALPVLYEIRSLWEDAAVDKGACREGDLRYRATRALESYVVRRSTRIVCICEGLRAEFAARGVPADRLDVIANAVDVDRFAEQVPRDEAMAAELGLTPGATLGFIGSFFAFEGLAVLLQAMPGILRAEPAARLVLVGGGPEGASLRRLARDLGVEEAVHFTGRVPHAEVQRYYGLVDVLVYPRVPMRITELVTPLKPLEAMASRKLVLASDVGGHREMVFDAENGALFRAGDPAHLAARCVELLSDRADWRRLQDNGRRYVESARSWRDNAHRYLEVYGATLAAPRAEAA